MDPERISYLYAQYQNSKLSSSELEELKALAGTAEFESQYQAIFDLYWGNLHHEALQSMSLQTQEQQVNYITSQARQTSKGIKLWALIALAAAAVAAIVFGVLLFSVPRHPDAGQDLAHAAQDIAPGKNTATLTLANGKTITLSDSKTGVVVAASGLSYNDGTEIKDSAMNGRHSELVSESRTGKATMLIASTPRGGTYQFTLPDGTRVWLNAASKISFPVQFTEATRKIVLSGEAYLEVAKNKTKPFIVKSSEQEVEVLGTHFNINAYGDENSTRTTLLEGSVAVTSTTPRSKRPNERALVYPGTVLLPNQQSILTKDNQVTVKQVDPVQAIAWKNGIFDFNNTPLESIMKQVSRWYDVEVIYRDDAAKRVTISGAVSRYDKVSRVLKALEFTGSVKFTVEGQKIFVRTNN